VLSFRYEITVIYIFGIHSCYIFVKFLKVCFEELYWLDEIAAVELYVHFSLSLMGLLFVV